VKWAGGKRQLADVLLKNAPEAFNGYHEPFVGGGALFFKLWAQGRIKRAYLNDYNPDLMNLYQVVKARPGELVEELSSKHYPNEKAAYYQLRQAEPQEPVLRAARFVYLNRTGFNGLYRVNSGGKFNVPYGRYKNPKICDEENISLVSAALRGAVLLNKDFSIVLEHAKQRDFVYFDPPYHPISKTSSFTSYTKADFSENEQVRLRDVYSELDGRGAFVMLSNSSAPLITELYSNYQTQNVLARRAINCKADRRGPVNEVLVSNWKN
jgi:DNA adenine methylase